MEKEYLGDSVYVQKDDSGGLWLTVENGLGPVDAIFLEPEVYAALVRYAQRAGVSR